MVTIFNSRKAFPRVGLIPIFLFIRPSAIKVLNLSKWHTQCHDFGRKAENGVN